MSRFVEALLNFSNWQNGVARVKATIQKDESPIRFGVLGAAAINYTAIIDPIQTHPGATLNAIAARDPANARKQLNKYGLHSAKAHATYEDILADPDIDAVYIPLPNGLHYDWAIKALDAGKHVLIEKPITSNADQATKLRQKAAETGKIALEAFHWRFHPAAHFVKELVEGGKYGSVKSIKAHMFTPGGAIPQSDIRFKYDLAGGSCMDLVYVFSAITYYATSDILNSSFNVTEAIPRLSKNDARVDDAMEATIVIETPNKSAVTCKVAADLSQPKTFGILPKLSSLSPDVTIELDKARVEFQGFSAPWLKHNIIVTEKDETGALTSKKHREKCYVDGPAWQEMGQSWWTSYRYQLEAFVGMIKAVSSAQDYKGPWVSLEESEKVMELVDMVYDKAGLPKRGVLVK